MMLTTLSAVAAVFIGLWLTHTELNIAAILALMPLALGIGAGSEMLQPLAIAIVSGLVVQMPLGLLVLPTLLIIFSTIKE